MDEPSTIKEETTVIQPRENTFLKKQKISKNETEESIDYDTISISNFGSAYLKGYGWKEGKGFGKSDKVVTPVTVELRPKLSGLGSITTTPKEETPSIIVAKENSLETAYLKQLLDHDQISVNHLIKILHGSYEGSIGRVLEMIHSNPIQPKYKIVLQEDHSIVIIKESDIEIITDLSKYNIEHPIRVFARNQEYIPSTVSSSSSSTNRITNWLLPNIRVRIISKQFQNGKYHLSKGTILDIPKPNSCTIQLDNNNTILDSVSESDLETIIPRECPCKVMIVHGNYKGKIGTCLSKDSNKQTCHVQLHHNHQIITLDYDEIAQVVL